MKNYYQVVTTPTADTPGSSLILHYPDKRYIFGQAAEGTQRAITERSAKLSGTTDLFLTGRTEWANTGGLIGLILTQSDIIATANAALEEHRQVKEERRRKHELAHGSAPGSPPLGQSGKQQQQQQEQDMWLTIHGGRNLTHTIAAARRFVFRQGTPLVVNEYHSGNTGPRQDGEDAFEKPTWADGNIRVWAMPVKPSSSSCSSALTSNEATVGATPTTIPRRSRKRSHDEFEETAVASDTQMSQETKDYQLRQSVVSAMFNSSWSLDSLTETPLKDVKQPAAMFVRNTQTKDLEPFPLPAEGEPLPDIKVFVRKPWPGATIERLPPTTRSQEALSYVIRGQDTRGKFDAKKAQALKVKMGPDCGRLANGESVQSQDGKTITPEMVLGPARLGKGVAIIDLPTPEYVDNLINRPEWDSPVVTTELSLFYWILGPGVGEHPKLREFVANRPHCTHLVSGTDYCPNYLALPSMAATAVRLARVHSEGYSVPVHDNVTLPQLGTKTAGSRMTQEAIRTSPFQPARPGLIIDVDPAFAITETEVLKPLNAAKIIDSLPRSVNQRVATINQRISKPGFSQSWESFQKDLPGADAEIFTLGTGSSIPSKYRNVSANLVHVPGQGYYLLDCGENTLGQMKRVFKPEKLREVLQNLRMIWISHLHADHHLGTASVIKAWYLENYGDEAATYGSPHQDDPIEMDMAKILREKRLFVVAEPNMVGWLEEYASVENYGFHKLVPLAATSPQASTGIFDTTFVYRHVRSDGTYPGQNLADSEPTTTTLTFGNGSSPLSGLLRSATGLENLLTTRVHHCRGAMAVSLVFPDGFKVSYSGDCRPSGSFARIGRGSTILIHEATFHDDMQGSAIAKKHSTMAEAIEVGRQMEARTILLTHFSQRYQRDVSQQQQPQPQPQQSGSSVRPREVVSTQLQHHRPSDVPVDDDPIQEPPHLRDTIAGANNDEIRLHTNTNTNNRNSAIRPSAPLTTSSTSASASATSAPIIMAFDYMRLQMKNVPLTQAYAPAVEKLFTIMERKSVEDAERARAEAEQSKLAAAARKEKKEKRTKELKVQKEKKEMMESEMKRALLMDGEQGQEGIGRGRSRSVWSASESESGWNLSEGESEAR